MFNIRKKTKVHFVGIGGIGMSGIAEVLIHMGIVVTGSDIAESANTNKLAKLGAEIFIGHKSDNVADATIVVFSSAINVKNPEYIYAQENSIPILKRAEMLAQLMQLKLGLAVAGTHGKTTTTSFLATILQESKMDPTYIIGGIVENLKGHAKVGEGNILVAEADESDGSFLLLSPVMSVITNIDNDHLDHYGSPEALYDAFNKFANRVPFYGLCSLNAHDDKLLEIRSKMKRPYTTFGIELDDIDFNAKNVKFTSLGSSYDLYYEDKKVVDININLPGEHNVLNSLGAISLAYNMGVSFESISSGIKKFDGVGRRLELLYSKGNFELIDDYGHHPTEILCTLKAVKETRKNKKLIVIFEPHRFSRTRDCWDSFLHCFNDADELYLGPIYPASEQPIEGITTDRLVQDINRLHPNFSKKLDSISNIGETIKKYEEQDATVVVLGAGSIGRLSKEWANSK